jgi:hypothetical protein
MATESESTTINLHNPVTITNATGTHRFGPGQGVKVPKDMASDLERIDYEAEQQKKLLMTKQKYETNAGQIAVGGE